MIDRIVFAILSAGCLIASSVWLCAAYTREPYVVSSGTVIPAPDFRLRNVGFALLAAALVFALLAVVRRRESQSVVNPHIQGA
ncbi:MAG TPA: hypothetical protein VF669_23905 [Tepidisphaeraceae bacterium]|jgi:membrane protein implicated in regulation of membrane protease activity